MTPTIPRPAPTVRKWTITTRLPAETKRCSPGAVVFFLLLTDTLALGIAVAISVLLKSVFAGPVTWGNYLALWPAIPIFLTVYASVGLYSVVALSTPDEIRRVSTSSAVVFIILAAATMTVRGGQSAFTWRLAWAIALTVMLIPLLRSALRRVMGSRPWWGYPAVVFGSGAALDEALDALTRHPGGGLVPVAIAVEDAGTAAGLSRHRLPVLLDSQLPSVAARSRSLTYAVVAASTQTPSQALELIERRCASFPKVILVSPFGGLTRLGLEPQHLAGEWTLQVTQQIYSYRSLVVKEISDRLLAAISLVALAPLFVLISLAIALESGRPIFFGHVRVGKGAQRFRAWKFRTMVRDADAALERYLADHPEARIEWEENHKLRNDPRVSRVGEWLRKTSLDELPQLYNVVHGEMSIVGPRPVVDAEVARYGDGIQLYYRVKGGITGLWQVSGRNDTTYQQRVALDLQYIRSWSVWLDLFIMARTVTAVLFRRGAY